MDLGFPKTNPVLYVILTGELLLFLSGVTITWSSSQTGKFSNSTTSPYQRALSSEEVSWISSVVTLGAAVGCFIYGSLWNKLGRMAVVFSLGLPFLAAYIILACTKSSSFFYFARLLAGIAVGGTFATVPWYIGEVAPKSITRRALISLLYCALCLGFLVSYIVGAGVDLMPFSCGLAAISAVFLLLFLYFGVECPQYYLHKDKYETARKSLECLRSGYETEYIDKEMMEIQAKVNEEKSGRIKDMFSCKAAIRTLTMAVGLMFFQQFSGIFAVFFYCETIFEMTGTGAVLDPNLSMRIVGVVQIVGSIATPVILELCGGKKPLLWSAIGMALSEITLGLYCVLRDHQTDVENVAFIPIVLIILIVIFYNVGLGPVPMMMMEEIFPAKVKTISVCTVWGMNWLMAFVVTRYFYLLVETFGLGELFLFFGACCVVSVVFTQCYVIETHGKTLEEIQDILSR